MSYSESLRKLVIKIGEQGLDDIKVPAKLIIEALKKERAGNSEAATEIYVLSCWNAVVEDGLKVFQEDVDKHFHKMGCKKNAQTKRKDTHDRYADWQDEAVMIWAKSPRKSVPQVAGEIAERELKDNDYEVSPNTIRRIIKKPK